MEDEELDLSTPACLYLLSAFLAMEPTDCLISLARECGGGSITKGVQSFIWEQCIRRTVGKNHRPSDSYIKNFLKKVIVHVESNCDEVVDGLYEQYAYYVTSLKDDSSAKAITRVCKSISFLFPDSNLEAPSCPTSKKVVVPLRCSLNMLEGDTGCSIWPSSLFLSEFILSFPEIFSNKSCFEVGSGVGLVGISLAYVKAYKVVLSDGDLSSLANMKLNLEMNQLTASTEMSQSTIQDPYLVECKYMRWESASESELQDFRPDIVLGADVIYDPLCLPHLMRVLSILLNPRKYNSHRGKTNCQGLSPEKTHVNNNGGNTDDYKIYSQYGSGNSETAADDNCHGADSCQGRAGFIDASNTESQFAATKKVPVAYIATVIRNLDTFNCFLRLAGEAHLSVVDITETQKPLDLVPYMRSYNRSSLRLLTVFFSGH